MFGIVFLVFNTIGNIISGTGAAIEERRCIERGKARRRNHQNNANIYIDRKGARRDLDTGELRYIDYRGSEEYGKDQCIRDVHGNVVRNLSDERRRADYIEAKDNPYATVMFWQKGIEPIRIGVNGNPYYVGDHYKDLDNGKLYVMRMLSITSDISGKPTIAGRFYMDVETGLLVRETDEQANDRRLGIRVPSEETCKKFIEYFNDKQSSTGFIQGSKFPKHSNESELEKCNRLNKYYLNNKVSYRRR